MKNLILIFGFLMTFFLSGCIFDEKHSPRTLESILIDDDYSSLDGDVLIFNDVISEEFGISNGDSCRAYYYMGRLKQLTNIHHGTRHGMHIEFEENGELYMLGQYFRGKQHGIWQSFSCKDENPCYSIFFYGKKIGES